MIGGDLQHQHVLEEQVLDKATFVCDGVMFERAAQSVVRSPLIGEDVRLRFHILLHNCKQRLCGAIGDNHKHTPMSFGSVLWSEQCAFPSLHLAVEREPNGMLVSGKRLRRRLFRFDVFVRFVAPSSFSSQTMTRVKSRSVTNVSAPFAAL